jgi:hypothetical protein
MPEGYRLDVGGMNRLADRLAQAEDVCRRARRVEQQHRGLGSDQGSGRRVFNAFEWVTAGGTVG